MRRRTRFVAHQPHAPPSSSSTPSVSSIDEETVPAKRRKTDNAFLKLAAHERRFSGNSMPFHDSLSTNNRIEFKNKTKLRDFIDMVPLESVWGDTELDRWRVKRFVHAVEAYRVDIEHTLTLNFCLSIIVLFF